MDHLKKNWNFVEKASLFYVSGFQLASHKESVVLVAKHAVESPGKTFAFNISAPYVCDIFGDRVLDLLPFIDVLFGNETEAQSLAKVLGLNERLDIQEIAIEVCKFNKENKEKDRVVVITQGADYVVTSVTSKESIESNKFPVKLLDPTSIVDSNAAGDAFVGGFLSQLIESRDLSTCVRAGIHGAQEVLKHSGCSVSRVNQFE